MWALEHILTWLGGEIMRLSTVVMLLVGVSGFQGLADAEIKNDRAKRAGQEYQAALEQARAAYIAELDAAIKELGVKESWKRRTKSPNSSGLWSLKTSWAPAIQPTSLVGIWRIRPGVPVATRKDSSAS